MNFFHFFQKEEEVTTPGEKMVLYLNPLDEWCTNIDYFTYLLKLGEITPKRLSDEGQIWLHFARETNLMLTLAFWQRKYVAFACQSSGL